MAYIEVNNISKTYYQQDGASNVLDQVSLTIDKGEFICLLGPSGCGKTTLLNAVAGFEQIDEGEIIINGQKVKQPQKEYITIFQNYGLLPWRTVEKNVMLGLENSGLTKAQMKLQAKQYLKIVGLESYCKYRPSQLSGGMQQRVAIARGLCMQPEILFMDEPFAALDALTRLKLQDDVLKLSRMEKKTILFVTHDIEEAIFLADRIVIMQPNPGHIRKIIPVHLGSCRDRTRDDFLSIRDKVFSYFEEKVPDHTEYYI